MTNPTPCIEARGQIQLGGYRRVYVRGRGKVYAHRLAWERQHGPIPPGMTIDHLCRNPACVNTEHLELVTHQLNCQRAAAARTHCPHGHPYTDENSYRRPNGTRYCRTCHREQAARKKAG